jgi:deazaflavin-dependent oxidoreductase (nitroreductase family)
MVTSTTQRAVVTGSLAAIALGWGWWALDPTASATPVWPAAQTMLLVLNVPLTISHPAIKRMLVVGLQRCVLNPMVHMLFRIGFVPFGFALLETIGRTSRTSRRVPVGIGLDGEVFWIISEHGTEAAYVRNLIAHPRVRVKLGLSFVAGCASYGEQAPRRCYRMTTRSSASD